MQTVDTINEVVLTDHSKERTGNSKIPENAPDPSDCSIPESMLKNSVRKKKGMLYWDNKTEVYHQVYNKTIIVFEYKAEEEEAVVITAYRIDNPYRYRRDRWEQIHW